MKKTSTIFAIALVAISLSAKAQSTEQRKKNADALKITVGGSFAKPKIVPKLEKLGIAQVTVTYKLTTSETKVGKDKSEGTIAGIKQVVYLETTDGQLTNEDFQEVTDHFYRYFQAKIKAAGIDTVAWNTIAGTDFYKDANDKSEDNEKVNSGGQVYLTFNANKGNYLYGGVHPFAFGKIKKASRFCDDIDAAAGFFYVTVDFADLTLDLKMSTTHSGYVPIGYTGSTTYTKEFHSAVKPVMKVIPDDRNSLFWNSKSQSEGLSLMNDIEAETVYHTSITQDASRLKNRAFAFAKSMEPVVIETTRAQYKAAAKKSLENYADAFIMKVKEYKD